MAESMQGDREFDVVLLGATGYTGRLVAEYLLGRYGSGGAAGLRWAIVGRSRERLEALRAGFGEAARDLATIVVDTSDGAALAALAGRTRVVCTTVGPYALYGSGVVEACARSGTHYCDLTGEVHWMRRMIDLHHETARESGARIVHTCGFDSIPSDLGVYFLQREMCARSGRPAESVRFRAREFRGGFSGGTIASMLNMLDEADRDPTIDAVLKDPYGLNPSDQRRGLDGPERRLPDFDPDFGAWVAPFVMGVINTKVVRRTNALLGYPYGHEFRYEEGSVIPGGMLGLPLAAGLGVASAAMQTAAGLGPVRKLMRALLPKPGEGPSEEVRATGFYVIELLGRTTARGSAAGDSQDLRVLVRGDRDPGYGSTSKMLAESAVCLALDPLDSPGGVLTPAAAMGDALLERLPANAGVTFEVC